MSYAQGVRSLNYGYLQLPATLRFAAVSLWVVALLIASAPLQAQMVVPLSDNVQKVTLAYPLPTRIAEDQDVPHLLLNSPFEESLFAKSISEGPEAYWHRIQLHGFFKDDARRSYSLVIKNLVLQHLDVYLFDGGELIASRTMGVADTVGREADDYLGPVFDFSISRDQQLTLLIRKQTDGSAILPAVIYSRDAFYDYVSQRNLFIGGVAIFLAIIALYNGVIGLLSRSRSYIWYLLFYMLTFVELSILLGFGHFIWPRSVFAWLAGHILFLNALLAMTAVLFATRFLAAKLYAPGFYRAGRYLLYLLPVAGLLSLWVPEYVLFSAFVVFQGIVSLFILSMAAQAFRNGFFPARFFFISWLCLLVGAAIGVAAYKNLIPANEFTLHGLMFGALAELAILSIALVDRNLFAEKESIKSAFTDPQTQLPNYSFFRNRFAEALEHSITGQKKLWLVMLRVRGIEAFTGLLGPGVTSGVYSRFIEQLNECLDREVWSLPIALPYGGDSYLISLPGNQMLLVAANVKNLERHIDPLIEAADKPIEVEGVVGSLTLELGIAHYNTRKITLEECYRRAQLALNQCELRRVSCYCFDQELDTISKQRLDLLADLRSALAEGQLQCYLQPQFDAQRRLRGAEALVRWEHPKRGMVSPGVFVPLAEQSFLVFRITQIMLDHVCRWLASVDVPEEFHVSINLSVLDLQEPELIPFIENTTRRYGVAPSRLIFEVTETAAMEGDQEFVAAVERLHELGFRVGLDDFGTGYSSLLYMQRMRPDVIKIDMGFVKAIHESEVNRKIVLAIVQIAQSTHAITVAEGVESEAECLALMRLGVDWLQGYLLGRPMSLSLFSEQFLALERTTESEC